MSEIAANLANSPAVPVGAARGVAGSPSPSPTAAGVAGPQANVAPAPAADRKPPPPDELQKQLDEIAREHDTSLRFRVDTESERVVVAVVDREGVVVMQIPDEAALKLARQLARNGRLVDGQA